MLFAKLVYLQDRVAALENEVALRLAPAVVTPRPGRIIQYTDSLSDENEKVEVSNSLSSKHVESECNTPNRA